MQLSGNGVTDFRRPPGEDPTAPAFSINLGGDTVPESSRTFCVKLLKEPSMGNWWMLRRPARIENTLQLQVPGPGARTLYLPQLFSRTSFQKQLILGPSYHHAGLALARGCQFPGLEKRCKDAPTPPGPRVVAPQKQGFIVGRRGLKTSRQQGESAHGSSRTQRP